MTSDSVIGLTAADVGASLAPFFCAEDAAFCVAAFGFAAFGGATFSAAGAAARAGGAFVFGVFAVSAFASFTAAAFCAGAFTVAAGAFGAAFVMGFFVAALLTTALLALFAGAFFGAGFAAFAFTFVLAGVLAGFAAGLAADFFDAAGLAAAGALRRAVETFFFSSFNGFTGLAFAPLAFLSFFFALLVAISQGLRTGGMSKFARTDRPHKPPAQTGCLICGRVSFESVENRKRALAHPGYKALRCSVPLMAAGLHESARRKRPALVCAKLASLKLAGVNANVPHSCVSLTPMIGAPTNSVDG